MLVIVDLVRDEVDTGLIPQELLIEEEKSYMMKRKETFQNNCPR